MSILYISNKNALYAPTQRGLYFRPSEVLDKLPTDRQTIDQVMGLK